MLAVDREGRVVAHAVAPRGEMERRQVAACLHGVLDAVDPVPILKLLEG